MGETRCMLTTKREKLKLGASAHQLEMVQLKFALLILNGSDNFQKGRKKAIHLIKVKVSKDYRAMDSIKIIIQSLLGSVGDLGR
jgi:hypothetical protein